MDRPAPREKRLSMIADGARLEIITWQIGDGEWALCVENEDGVRSNWYAFFDSADAAIAAARKAVREEGADAFTGMDDFDFLS